MYLGLTGARLKLDDLIYCGIASDANIAAVEKDIIAALADGESPGNLMSEIHGHYVLQEHAPPLQVLRESIDKNFGGSSVEEILENLLADGSDWTLDTAKTIRTKSPTSLKITFRQIREGAKLGFDDCMRMEYRMVNRVIAGHDFYEGVRGTIIDKDGAPKWRPSALSDVTDKDIDAYFAPLGDRELPL